MHASSSWAPSSKLTGIRFFIAIVAKNEIVQLTFEFRYYNVLLKRLKNGLKSGEITESQITELRWKRVFSNRSMDHSDFYAALDISQPE